MDGFQNRPFGQGPAQGNQALSPQSPQTPSYQTNVNRSKTRKWVQAPMQTYDGDDWGGDEYDVEPDVPSQSQPTSSGLPSQNSRYDAPAAPSIYTEASSMPSQAAHVPSQSYGNYPADGDFGAMQRKNTTRKPVGSGAQPTSIDADSRNSTNVPPQPDIPQAYNRPAAAPTTETLPQTQSVGKDDLPAATSDDPAPAQESAREPANAHDDEAASKGSSSSPTLPDVARMSAFGTDLFAGESKRQSSIPLQSTSPIPESPSTTPAPVPDPSSQDAGKVGSVTHEEAAPQTGSPDISDNAREEAMDDTDAAPSNLWRPSVPGQGRSEPVANSPTERDISPVSERNPGPHQPAPIVTNQSLTTTGLTDGSATVAPLRTPSPRVSTVGLPVAASGLNTAEGRQAGSEVVQTREPEHSPFDYDNPEVLGRVPTFSTVTSSPMKESDILRDEIIKSLSPRGEAPPQPFGSGQSSRAPSTHPPAAQSLPSERAAPVAPHGPSPSEGDSGDARGSEGDDRRRFSWEMGNEDATPIPTPVVGSTDNQVPTSRSEETGQQSKSASDDSDEHVMTAAGASVDSPRVVEPANEEPGVSHQVSKASSAHPLPGQAQSLALEPPSPVSEPSDRYQPDAGDQQSPQIRDKSPAQSEKTTQPAGQSATTLAQAPSTQTPLMTFREIMNMGNCSDRIAKYEEARIRFATIDSGLGDWLADLKASQPDHANAGSSFAGNFATLPGQSGNASSPLTSPTAGQVPSQQQPYYQQYLNASTPSAGGQSSTRSRFANLPHTAQVAGSAFGHSSNQIGTKGKEFMQSAGKMGKGLLSKGKNKLRGDKQDDSPPTTPVQGKVKSDRRSSWAMNLTNRSRTGVGLTSQSTVDKAGGQSMLYSSQPSTATGRTSIGGGPRPSTGGRRPSIDPQQGRASIDRTGHEDLQQPRKGDGGSALTAAGRGRSQSFGHSREPSLPLTIESRDGAAWDPFNGTPYASRTESSGPIDTSNGDHIDSRRLNSGRLADNTVPESSSQPNARPQDLKRDPSFGLPQIKRSDTLDFGLSKFQPEDQLSSETPREAAPDSDAVADTQVPTETGPTADGPTGQRLDAPLPPVPHLGGTQSSAGPQQSTAAIGAPSAELPKLKTPPSDHGGMKLPAGPWKLEESYLSAPLHQVSRKRSDTSESQQFTYGFDKETGLTSPISPSPASPPTTTNPRQRPQNHLPPSSAQRYPELFRQPPNGRSDSWSADAQGSSEKPSFPRSQSYDVSEDEAAVQGDRGRRKNSGLFKEFGGRFARAASRERRGSAAADAVPVAELVRSDGASEASIWSESTQGRKKKRSSFMGLRRRPSADIGYSGTESAQPEQNFAGEPGQSKNNRLSALQGKVTGFADGLRKPKQDGLGQARDTSIDPEQRSIGTPPSGPPSQNLQGQRGRRSSSSNLIAGMLGRSSSKNRTEQQRPNDHGDTSRNENTVGHSQTSLQGERGAGRMSLPASRSGDSPYGMQVRQDSSNPMNPQATNLDVERVHDSRRSMVSLSQSSSISKTQEASAGSRWKGLKGRVTGQLAQMKGSSQGGKSEKPTGGKRFGAFRRSSKLPEELTPRTQSPLSQGQGFSTPPASLGSRQPTAQSQGFNPQTQQRPMGPPSSFGAQIQQQPMINVPSGPHDFQQQQQQSMVAPIGNSHGHTRAPQMGGPAPGNERQYEQVPIPQAYGSVAAARANMQAAHPMNGNAQQSGGQNQPNFGASFPQQHMTPSVMSQPQFQPQQQASPPLFMQTQFHPQQHVSPPPNSQSRFQPHSQPQQQLQNQVPPRRMVSGSSEVKQVPQRTEPVPPVTLPSTSPPPTQPRSDGQIASSSPSMNSQDRFVSQPPSVPPPTSSLPAPPKAVRPEYPRGDSEVLPKVSQKPIQRKPTVPKADARAEKPSANLSVDVAKAKNGQEDDIYDATPRITQDEMSQAPQKKPAASQPVVTPRQTSEPTKPKEAKTGFVMELEDTEEARKRTMRLDSQEEKIFYDPADDEENPAMCATSYPGQEWNPYGDFDINDLDDDVPPRK